MACRNLDPQPEVEPESLAVEFPLWKCQFSPLDCQGIPFQALLVAARNREAEQEKFLLFRSLWIHEK